MEWADGVARVDWVARVDGVDRDAEAIKLSRTVPPPGKDFRNSALKIRGCK